MHMQNPYIPRAENTQSEERGEKAPTKALTSFDKYWPFTGPPSMLATPYTPWSVTFYTGHNRRRVPRRP